MMASGVPREPQQRLREQEAENAEEKTAGEACRYRGMYRLLDPLPVLRADVAGNEDIGRPQPGP